MEGKSGLYSLLILFYFIRIISFVDRSIEERGGGVKGGGNTAAECFSYFVIYERNSPFLFILFSEYDDDTEGYEVAVEEAAAADLKAGAHRRRIGQHGRLLGGIV